MSRHLRFGPESSQWRCLDDGLALSGLHAIESPLKCLKLGSGVLCVCEDVLECSREEKGMRRLLDREMILMVVPECEGGMEMRFYGMRRALGALGA